MKPQEGRPQRPAAARAADGSLFGDRLPLWSKMIIFITLLVGEVSATTTTYTVTPAICESRATDEHNSDDWSTRLVLLMASVMVLAAWIGYDTDFQNGI